MKLFRKVIAATAGATLGLFAAQASAAVYTINFATDSSTRVNAGTLQYGVEDINLTVSAGANAKGGEFNINSSLTAWQGQGLGVQTSYSYNKTTKTCALWIFVCLIEGPEETTTHTATDSNHEIDNNGRVREFVMLDFGGLEVQLLSVDFANAYHQSNDDVQILDQNGQLYAGGADPVYLNDEQALSSLFWVYAGRDASRSDDDFKLRSISFSYTAPVNNGPNPQEDPSDVPTPAALSLLGLGMVGLGVARRRRRA